MFSDGLWGCVRPARPPSGRTSWACDRRALIFFWSGPAHHGRPRSPAMESAQVARDDSLVELTGKILFFLLESRENQKAMISPLLFVLSGNRELKSSLLVGLLPSGFGTSASSFFLRICFSIVFYHFIEKNFFSVDQFFVEEYT